VLSSAGTDPDPDLLLTSTDGEVLWTVDSEDDLVEAESPFPTAVVLECLVTPFRPNDRMTRGQAMCESTATFGITEDGVIGIGSVGEFFGSPTSQRDLGNTEPADFAVYQPDGEFDVPPTYAVHERTDPMTQWNRSLPLLTIHLTRIIASYRPCPLLLPFCPPRHALLPGNFVAYTDAGEPVWSTRSAANYPEGYFDFFCGRQGNEGCSFSFAGSNSFVEWLEEDYYCPGTALRGDQSLSNKEFRCSPNGLHRFGLDRGDVGLWRRGQQLGPEALGNDNTEYRYSNRLVMQLDGNMVLYDFEGVPLWDSRTNGNAGATASLDDTGVLRIKSSNGSEIASFGG